MQNSDILSLAHLRTDGRRYDELRTIKHKLNLFNGSDGSAYLEQGKFKLTYLPLIELILGQLLLLH
jgi:exosome complex RNA-binding protein Rrp42 (RNase PH superfamily)